MLFFHSPPLFIPLGTERTENIKTKLLLRIWNRNISINKPLIWATWQTPKSLAAVYHKIVHTKLSPYCTSQLFNSQIQLLRGIYYWRWRFSVSSTEIWAFESTSTVKLPQSSHYIHVKPSKPSLQLLTLILQQLFFIFCSFILQFSHPKQKETENEMKPNPAGHIK